MITLTEDDVRYMLDRLHSIVYHYNAPTHLAIVPVEVTQEIRDFLKKVEYNNE